MGNAVKNYKDSLDRATSSRSSDGVPNVTVISADADGWQLPVLQDFED
jgi:hypothetical protein